MNQGQEPTFDVLLNDRSTNVPSKYGVNMTSALQRYYNSGLEQDAQSAPGTQGKDYSNLASILLAALASEESYISRAISKAGGDRTVLVRGLQQVWQDIPKSADGIVKDLGYLAPIFAGADNVRLTMGDKFHNTDHLVAALLQGEYQPSSTAMTAHYTKLQEAFANAGIDADIWQKTIEEMRHGARIGSRMDGELFDSLGLYTNDMAILAVEKPEPVFLGRRAEIDRIEAQLAKAQGNSAWLTGDFGVGKTAIAEAVADRISLEESRAELRGRVVLRLNMSKLITGQAGDPADRLRAICDEAARDGNKILLIDEVERLLLDNGAIRANVAVVLNDVLSAGRLPMLLTSDGGRADALYSNDASLFDKLARIDVREPSAELATEMLYAHRERIEQLYGVTITDEALQRAVAQTQKYQADKRLPKKAVDALEAAASQVALEKERPAQLVKLAQTQENIEAELRRLNVRQDAAALQRKAELTQQQAEAVNSEAELEAKWEQELEIYKAVQRAQENIVAAEDKQYELRTQIEQLAGAQQQMQLVTDGSESKTISTAAPSLATQQRELKTQLKTLERKLPQLQQQLEQAQKAAADYAPHRLVDGTVNAVDIDEAIERSTGIRIKPEETDKFAKGKIEAALRQRVVGQDKAIAIVAGAVRRAAMGLRKNGKTLGVFFFAGPSGVGKTELSLALAEFLGYNMLRYNMNNFTQAHTVATLLGSPHGYEGGGGPLVRDIKQNPNSVILLDEYEKAHADFSKILMDLFDTGRTTDNRNNSADASNCYIVMTSNIGEDYFRDYRDGVIKTEAELLDEVKRAYEEKFPASFQGRVENFIIFNNLDPAVTREVVPLQLRKLNEQFKDNKLDITMDAATSAWLAEHGYDPHKGVRPLQNLFDKVVANGVNDLFMDGDLLPGQQVSITLQPQTVQIQTHASAEDVDARIFSHKIFYPTLAQAEAELQKHFSNLSDADKSRGAAPEAMHSVEVMWPSFTITDKLAAVPAIELGTQEEGPVRRPKAAAAGGKPAPLANS